MMLVVAPHAGAWIETRRGKRQSLSARVAPHAGAWIETTPLMPSPIDSRVAPHAGAWIETTGLDATVMVTRKSRPTRARGLKHDDITVDAGDQLVAPHAGAWIETFLGLREYRPKRVAPHAGAWIETSSRAEN